MSTSLAASVAEMSISSQPPVRMSYAQAIAKDLPPSTAVKVFHPAPAPAAVETSSKNVKKKEATEPATAFPSLADATTLALKAQRTIPKPAPTPAIPTRIYQKSRYASADVPTSFVMSQQHPPIEGWHTREWTYHGIIEKFDSQSMFLRPFNENMARKALEGYKTHWEGYASEVAMELGLENALEPDDNASSSRNDATSSVNNQLAETPQFLSFADMETATRTLCRFTPLQQRKVSEILITQQFEPRDFFLVKRKMEVLEEMFWAVRPNIVKVMPLGLTEWLTLERMSVCTLAWRRLPDGNMEISLIRTA